MSDEPKKGPPDRLVAYARLEMLKLAAVGLITLDEAEKAGKELIELTWRCAHGEISEEEMCRLARELGKTQGSAPAPAPDGRS